MTGTMTYFGSANSRVIEQDFTSVQRRDFTIRRQVLWESEGASDAEVRRVEVEYIRALGANNPEAGYNRWPRHRVTGKLAVRESHGRRET